MFVRNIVDLYIQVNFTMSVRIDRSEEKDTSKALPLFFVRIEIDMWNKFTAIVKDERNGEYIEEDEEMFCDMRVNVEKVKMESELNEHKNKNKCREYFEVSWW